MLCLHCISLSVMPVVLCAWIRMFNLSISVGGESPGQLGEVNGRTGGLAHCCDSDGVTVTRFVPINVRTSTYDWTFLCHWRGHYNTIH